MTKQRGQGRPRAVLAKPTRIQRIDERQRAGQLKELLVGKATATRYVSAMKKFFEWCRVFSRSLPGDYYSFDGLLCEYIEYLWEHGDGRSLACDTLSGLQCPTTGRTFLKGHLRGAWALTRAWQRHELPARAPPLPSMFVFALAQWLVQSKAPDVAAAIILGYHCVLRTGELLKLVAGDFVFSDNLDSAVVDLGLTKSGSRRGVKESITITQAWIVKLLRAATLSSLASAPLVQGGSYRLRRLFAAGLTALQLTEFGFKPYSLRRGGATELWRITGNMGLVTQRGRWAHQSTARIYVNDGLAVLSEIVIDKSHREQLLSLSSAFCATINSKDLL